MNASKTMLPEAGGLRWKRAFMFLAVISCLLWRGDAVAQLSATLTANPVAYKGSCPTVITFTGAITSTKVQRVVYVFTRSDGAIDTEAKILDFSQPGSQNVTTTWTLGGDGLSDYSGWEAIKIIHPATVKSKEAKFQVRCTSFAVLPNDGAPQRSGAKFPAIADNICVQHPEICQLGGQRSIVVKAREAWAKTMHHTPALKQGCFHASYPSTQWQEVQCAPPNGWRSALPRNRKNLKGGHGEVFGPGLIPPNSDIVVQAPSGHLFSSVTGSFPTVNGVTSETSSSGVQPGANEYSLQLNTNDNYSAACGSYSNCVPWVQFVMATNAPVSLTNCTSSSCPLTNQTQVFIEYWLLNYGVDNGSNICPSGFIDNNPDPVGPGDDCVQNSPATVIDWNPPTNTGQLPITDLADLSLSGSATANGNDEATVTYNGQAYKATVADDLTDIASVWNQAEFNVLGNAGLSEAVFNDGSSIIVKSAVTYTPVSTSAPSCIFNGGTTGETNNLTFVPSNTSPVCCPHGGSDPSIEFMEVFDTSHTHTASCGSSSIIGEPHITTVNDVYYNFQAAGEFIALLDSDGTEIQTRQTPIPTLAPGNYDPSKTNNDGLLSCLAMNTAVAARVGTHRITYEPSVSAAYGAGPFDLRIDGRVTTLGAEGVNLGGGAGVKNSAAGGGIEVDFPDGKIMTAIPSGSLDSMKFLNVQFEKTGLLDDGDGAVESGIAGAVPRGSWLPALPTGASLGAMPATLHERYVTLYSTFANAWRVTSENTLFDYAPGTSTATFTNTKWPVENATTCTMPNQTVFKPVSAAVAEEACKSISDAKLHAGCLFDVQATGYTGLADTYQASESAHKILSVKPIDAKLLVPGAK